MSIYFAGEHGSEVVTRCCKDETVGRKMFLVDFECDITEMLGFAKFIHTIDQSVRMSEFLGRCGQRRDFFD
jgi:hypothetical protein